MPCHNPTWYTSPYNTVLRNASIRSTALAISGPRLVKPAHHDHDMGHNSAALKSFLCHVQPPAHTVDDDSHITMLRRHLSISNSQDHSVIFLIKNEVCLALVYAGSRYGRRVSCLVRRRPSCCPCPDVESISQTVCQPCPGMALILVASGQSLPPLLCLISPERFDAFLDSGISEPTQL